MPQTLDDAERELDQKIAGLEATADSQDVPLAERRKARAALKLAFEAKVQLAVQRYSSRDTALRDLVAQLNGITAGVRGDPVRAALNGINQAIGKVVAVGFSTDALDGLIDDVAAIASGSNNVPVSEPPAGGGGTAPGDSMTGFADMLGAAAAQFGIDRRLLAGVALIESGIRNIASRPGSSATGPFQFLKGTWKAMVEEHGDRNGITVEGIVQPAAQAVMAAIAFRDYARALRNSIGRDPKNAELYLCHFLGPAAAAALLKADPAQGCDAALRSFYERTQLGAAFVDKILAVNPLLKDGGAVKTVGKLLSDLDAKVGKAITSASKTLFGSTEAAVSQPPAPPPAAPAADDPTPWYTIARAEEAKGIKERPGTEHHPRIVEYHQTTTLKATDDETFWCSSFVNFCVTAAGLQGTNSAAARSWADWGRRIDTPQEGCIVALARPDGGPTSGHVGFFVKEVGSKIRLLGGNQSNTIGEGNYKKADLLSYRMP